MGNAKGWQHKLEFKAVVEQRYDAGACRKRIEHKKAQPHQPGGKSQANRSCVVCWIWLIGGRRVVCAHDFSAQSIP
jgi:hypothetical protein